MPAMFDYGNLLSAQGRGSYAVNHVAPQSAFNSQNWAGLGAAAAAGRASDRAAEWGAFGTMGATGLKAFGDVASSGLMGYAQLGSSAVTGLAGLKARQAEAAAAIQEARIQRGSPLGALAGIAGLAFMPR